MQADKQLSILSSPLPFSTKTESTLAPYGSNITQIVNSVFPARYIGAEVGALVTINNEVVPREMWHRVRPKLGAVVKVNVVPQGGGGKGGMLGTILTIAVMVAAPYLGASALGAFSGLGVGALSSLSVGGITITASAVGAAISTVGMMAIAALVPPPKQSAVGTPQLSTKQAQYIEGASNALNPWGRIPILLGTRRVFPPQCARPWLENVGDDQYSRQLFTWGYGKVSITNEKFGETPVTNFDDFETEHKLDGDLNDGTSLYSNDVDYQQYNVLLVPEASYTVRTTHTDTDEALIDLTWPQGIVWIRQNGRKDPREIVYSIQFREVGSVGAWTNIADYTIKAATNEAIRRSVRAVFPSRSQYDIRIRRVTPAFVSTSTFDAAYLSAIKSITHVNPVNLDNISGTAMRIRATEQMNGAVESYNAIASSLIKSYDEDTETWVDDVASSNPADIYRYVLQSSANNNALLDAEINIEDLEAWHEYCTEQGYTFDAFIDGDVSVAQVLSDVAAAGSATPAIVDGLRTIIIDKTGKDVVQIVTPRNSWNYSGTMLFQELPHAYRVQFPNKDQGYQQDERIVYDDGYDESNATIFEILELPNTVTSEQAFKNARRYIATARLRPETHTFSMDVESIYFLRGDRIVLEHDVPVVGVGDARVKEVVLDMSNNVVGIHIDDTITIPQNGTYYCRIRLADGTFVYQQINVVQGFYTYLEFTTPFPRPELDDVDLLNVGDLLIVVEAGAELDLIVTRISPKDDLSAEITAVNYAPEIFTAESAPIPPFTSGLTVPLEFIRPLAPVFVSVESGVEAFLINSDGSYITRAVFTLQNDNVGALNTFVKVRKSGTDVFSNAQTLEQSPTRVTITGLDDGELYDVRIYYQRADSNVISEPMELNNWKFIGASAPPSDVTGFRVQVVDNMLIFEWDRSPDIDYDHAVIRFMDVYTGATWEESMTLKPNVYDTTVTVPFIGGTYLIKFVDRLGFESENATAVITYDPSGALNVVQNYQEQPTWAGVKVNTEEIDGELSLIDVDQVGYYYFANNPLDLEDVYESRIYGSFRYYAGVKMDLYALDDLYDPVDLYNISPSVDLYDLPDLYDPIDLLFTEGSVRVTLEWRRTLLDPNESESESESESGGIWTDWEELIVGKYSFRGAEFRLKLESLDAVQTPFVTLAEATVDMPDRFEKGNDLTVDATLGATITYATPFLAVPSTLITIQDGDADDEIEFIYKEEGGFSFKVFNTGSSTYVTRLYDFLSAGYGRAIT